jgi:hypothetical protein
VGVAGTDAGGSGGEAALVRGGVRAREPVPVAVGVAEGAADVRVAVVPAAPVEDEEEEEEEEEGEGSLEVRGRRLGSPETPAAPAVPAILSLEDVAVGLGVAATEPPGPKIDPLVAVFEGAVGGAL